MTAGGDAVEEPSAEAVARAAAAFGVLSSPLRLRLVRILLDGESDVSALAAAVGNAMSTASENLAMLRAAGLVRSRRAGRRVLYAVEDPRVETLVLLMLRRFSVPDAGPDASGPPA
ncbi:metalloregulator ArsR/SmtB family transcription factor [Streptomyces sp. NPDC004031]